MNVSANEIILLLRDHYNGKAKLTKSQIQSAKLLLQKKHGLSAKQITEEIRKNSENP